MGSPHLRRVLHVGGGPCAFACFLVCLRSYTPSLRIAISFALTPCHSFAIVCATACSYPMWFVRNRTPRDHDHTPSRSYTLWALNKPPLPRGLSTRKRPLGFIFKSRVLRNIQHVK